MLVLTTYSNLKTGGFLYLNFSTLLLKVQSVLLDKKEMGTGISNLSLQLYSLLRLNKSSLFLSNPPQFKPFFPLWRIALCVLEESSKSFVEVDDFWKSDQHFFGCVSNYTFIRQFSIKAEPPVLVLACTLRWQEGFSPSSSFFHIFCILRQT